MKSTFNKWDIIPGDPLNKNFEVKKLEPASPGFLSRDVFLKTRRLKGLSTDLDLMNYFEDDEFFENINSEE